MLTYFRYNNEKLPNVVVYPMDEALVVGGGGMLLRSPPGLMVQTWRSGAVTAPASIYIGSP